MNAQEMLDHVFGQLDGPAGEQADRGIAADPDYAAILGRLERSIDWLLDDGEVIEPPAGLAPRTVTLVADYRRRRGTVRDFVPVKVPFRGADVAVAASIFLAGLLTLLPAVHRSEQRMAQAGCGFNLQQLGLGLAQYANIHHYYPYANPDCPAAHAGTFVAMLRDAGLLNDLAVLDCPCNGTCRAIAECPLPDHKTLARMRLKDPEQYRRLLCWDYAYNIGYRHEHGRPGPIETVAARAATIPLLADQPAHVGDQSILEGNSLNHGGRGQNVLFSDLRIRWHNTRRVGPQDADMFLNDDRRPAPGSRLTDAVLLPSLFPFAGR
jgi:hypothetical protein